MRKTILGLATILIVAILVPLKTYAVGGFSVSTLDITLRPGESTTFSITASNSAGKIDLSTSDADIASIDKETIFLDMDSEDITIKANSIGTTTITVSASSNFATYDEEILEGQSCTITVNVTEESHTDDNAQDNNTIDNHTVVEDIDATKPTNDTLSIPDTGGYSQEKDYSSQIILSSIIGASFAILSFVISYIYLHKKHAKHQS